MKQYSILRDVLTTKVYGLAVKNANNFEFLGFNKQSCQWANLANQKQLDISQLPDGIIAEDFQEITEDIAKQFDIKIDPISNTSTPVRKKINNFHFEKSERLSNPSRTPSITDIPLSSFNEDVRQMVLEFKTKTFRQNTIRGEIALKSRFNQLAFDPNTSKFNPRPNSNFKKIHAEELQTKASNIVQRRFGKEIIQQINLDIETKWPGEFIAGFLLGKRKGRKKRKKTGMKTMEILDFHEKGIGRAIGRAATPNVGRSRRIGMRSSREITGQLDPSRRRDVDGDGLIFDGTWREMPDPTRFKPNERVQKPSSPDPYKPIGSQTGQVLEEIKKRRGVRSQTSRTESESSQERGVRLLKRDFKTPEEELESINQSLEMAERAPIGSQSLRLREFNAEQELLKRRKKYLENLIQRGGKYDPGKGPGLKKEEVEDPIESLTRRLRDGSLLPSGAPKIRGVRSQSRQSFVTSKQKLGELPKNVRFYIQELKKKFPSDALFQELGAGVISDTNRRAALYFLDSIENQYQRQDNQSPSVVNRRAISNLDRIAAAHLAKIIARTDNNYQEERFNPIDGIDYSPVDEIIPDPSRIKPEPSRGLRSQSSQNLSRTEARTPIGTASRSNYPLRSEPPLNPPESELSDEFIDDYLRDSVSMGELELEDFKKYNKQSKKPLNDSELQDLFDRYKSFDNDVHSRASEEVINQFYDELVDDNYESMLSANEPYEPDEPETFGLRSSSRRTNVPLRSSGRGTRPLPVAMTPNARRAIATTERASSPRGLQSRSGVKKQGKGIPGVDKIGPSDGAQWEALTPDQKTTATAALDKEVERVTGELKKRFAGYWRGQVRGAKKQGIRGGRYAPRANDEALTTSDITEMQRQLDSNTSAKPEVRAAVQKQIDAVRLLTTMKSKKDYSMLEQLHPAQKAKVLDALKKTDNFKPLKGFTRTSESTAFKGGAGLSKEDLLTSLTPDVSLDDKKKDKKNISFRNRILRANPERQKRRELRRQRRTGAVGRTGISLDPELQLKKRKLRAAAFKRQILSKFRKSKDAEKLSDSLGERKAELHPVQIDADGNIKLAPNFVETMDSLDKRLLGGKKEGDRVYDAMLRDLWENFGYSEVPALVTEEEVKSLLAAGWQPIVRGTGNEEVMSESYVEQFLTSEGRFIAGQGGRAYGVGEYFAYPGGNWSGYSGGADSRHTMLVLIPPSATILTRRELSNEQAEMNRLTTSINNDFKIAGDRETVSALSAQELAQMIRKASPQLANSKTRSGQILNQLTLRLEELDNIPGDTSQERKRILNTFDLLERMSKKESGHFAPMIGVDAIDTNDGDGSSDPILLHNRSIVAAFQAPMTRKQAEEMSSGVKKVWTKFKSRNKVISAEQSPDSDSTATRRVKPRLVRRTRLRQQPQTQQSAQPQSQVKKSTSAVDTSSWKTGTPQNTGSNPATLLYAPDGTEYYTKLPKPGESVQQATERMETEVLASELYKLAGVPTVDLQMGDDNGTPQMLSKMVRSRGPNSQADQDSAREGFVVDAWLANWDAPLNDNIKFDGQNKPIRIDVGGSLDYRAQGSKKETTNTPFGDTVGEILSMQKRGTFNFANMDPAEIKKQAQAMSSVTDASIRSTVSKIVSDPQRAAKLAQTLINRRNDIVTRYG